MSLDFFCKSYHGHHAKLSTRSYYRRLIE